MVAASRHIEISAPATAMAPPLKRQTNEHARVRAIERKESRKRSTINERAVRLGRRTPA
jgi:hypothetical protein